MIDTCDPMGKPCDRGDFLFDEATREPLAPGLPFLKAQGVADPKVSVINAQLGDLPAGQDLGEGFRPCFERVRYRLAGRESCGTHATPARWHEQMTFPQPRQSGSV